MKLLRWTAGLLLTAAAVLANGSNQRPCSPAEGDSLSGLAHPDAQQQALRVGTFNIQSGHDLHGHFDLSRTAASLNGLDLVGLNEVRGQFFWQQANQAEALGRLLDLPWLFAPSERRWYRDDFGNGLLTSHAVTHWKRVPLPATRGKGFRNFIQAEVQWGPETLHVLVTHIDRTTDREAQLAAVTKVFLSLPEPAILMGDMNSNGGDPQVRRLLESPGVHDPIVEVAAGDPPPRIDWIFTRGLRAIAAAVEPRGASDHPLVWAELERAR